MNKILSLIFFFTSALVLVAARGDEESPASSSPSSSAPYTVPGFSTDFTRRGVNTGEIISGGPGKDGIPALSNPGVVSQEEARQWLAGQEPVILVQAGGEARIYPLQILTWHEIVNDELGGVPLVVTFCPLCNTSIVYQRRLHQKVYDFGTTGRLLYSNLIMYDRQDETWWQQATGKGILGKLTGETLSLWPALTLSFDEAVTAAPQAKVLSQETGHSRPYGKNPYTRYDAPNNRPFLFQGPQDPRRGMLDRVLAITIEGEEAIFAYSELREELVKHARLGGQDLVVFWGPGTASALDDKTIAQGKDVGAANAFNPWMGGQQLTFSPEDGKPGHFRDKKTNSLWNNAGLALEGPLQGNLLTPLPAIQHFWFSAYAFSGEIQNR